MPTPVATFFPMAQFAQKMGEGLAPEYEGRRHKIGKARAA